MKKEKRAEQVRRKNLMRRWRSDKWTEKRTKRPRREGKPVKEKNCKRWTRRIMRMQKGFKKQDEVEVEELKEGKEKKEWDEKVSEGVERWRRSTMREIFCSLRAGRVAL